MLLPVTCLGGTLGVLAAGGGLLALAVQEVAEAGAENACASDVSMARGRRRNGRPRGPGWTYQRGR